MGNSFEILGQKVSIQDRDPEQSDLAQIAVKIVHQKIDDLMGQHPTWGPQQIAVLALLEMAAELIKDRKAMDLYRAELDKKCALLMKQYLEAV